MARYGWCHCAFISYSRQFTRPLNDLANIFNIFQSAVAGAERVFQVIDETEEQTDKPGADRLSQAEGKVSFRTGQLWLSKGFSYPERYQL